MVNLRFDCSCIRWYRCRYRVIFGRKIICTMGLVSQDYLLRRLFTALMSYINSEGCDIQAKLGVVVDRGSSRQ